MSAFKKTADATHALITGASSGIGRELTRIFARQGTNLVLVARDEGRLEQLADEVRKANGVDVMVMAFDLSRVGAAQEIFIKLQLESIRIDFLVNNAGFDVYGRFFETDLALELQMIHVNLIALTQLTKFFLADMVERGYGKILNLGSTGSFVASPLNAVYSATKAYVLSFSEALTEELRRSGVTVTALCPGATKTEFQQRAGMNEIRLLRLGVMDAEAVAEIGFRAMMSGKRIIVPGFFNKLQVFLTRLLPRRVMVRAARMMLE
jgi:short-subunit dehydrogenase